MRHRSRSLWSMLIVTVCALAGVAAGAEPRPFAAPPTEAFAPRDLDVMRRAQARALPLVADGSAGLQRARLAGDKAPPALHAMVLLCDFADSSFYGRPDRGPEDPATSTQSDFYTLVHDAAFYRFEMRDVADYFAAVSGGRFTLHYDVHPRVIHLPRPMGWYGDHPEEGEQPFLLASEAVLLADPDVDFDGYDTLVLIHAGAGEETDVAGNSAVQIYSTYLGPEDFETAVEDTILATPFLATADADTFRHVLVLPENEFQDAGVGLGRFGSRGVYCFEFGLRLGMLSLSDPTPSGRPDSQGIGNYGLMGWGLYAGLGLIPPHPVAFNKLLMGWLTPQEADAAAGATWTLTPSEAPEDPQSSLRVDISGREYWLLEYRLQDPDGTGIFNFGGDLNHNNIPDFYDADSATGDGRPTSWFDPTTDIREPLIGAEWDFFMSENPGRAPGVKGAGSGIYIWHVDEGVIQDALRARRSIYNANPQRKGVDLEEADGIQDLDTSRRSDYWLASDDDSYRFEDTSSFSPTTQPATDTAGGGWTGVVFDQISRVVRDSMWTFHAETDSAYVGIRYVDAMTVQVARAAADASRLDRVASVTAATDLAGSHLIAGDLDETDGNLEVLAVGRDGALVVYEYGDAEVAPRWLTTDAGDTVRFRQPAAFGRLEGGPGGVGADILLTSASGLHHFRYDESTGLVPQGLDPLGRLLPADAPTLVEDLAYPPVLVPAAGDPDALDPDAAVRAWVVERGATEDLLFWRSAATSGQKIPLGAGRVASPPVAARGRLWLALADTATGRGRLFIQPLAADAAAQEFALATAPGPFPIVMGEVDDELAVMIVDASGRGTTIWLEAMPDDGGLLRESQVREPWPADRVVLSPLGGALGCLTEAGLARLEASGRWVDGWPRQPYPALSAPADAARAAMPLQLAEGLLFVAGDGRIYLATLDGAMRPGYPVTGPADCAGTPVVADLDGDGDAELVAAGAFHRIAGVDADGESVVTAARSTLVIYRGLGGQDGEVRMWGGSPWGGRWVNVAVDAPTDADGGLAVAGSFVCYPSPVTGGVLHVRVQPSRPGRGRATLFSLEGEEVTSAAWRPTHGGVALEVDLQVTGIASGMYVCRLELESEDGHRELDVKPVAVVH